MSATQNVRPMALRDWITRALTAVGVDPAGADLVSRHLVQTSLWGIDSHGVARTPHYLDRLTRQSIVGRPNMLFSQTGAATGDLDGGHGLGFVVCAHAMEKAIELARSAGVGVVGVRNSSHCGAIGLYTRQATQAHMIGIAFTHSDSFVVPHGGTEPFFGTNPISIAIPTPNPERPLCLDMATSVVPLNRIMNARRENQPLQPGWAVDVNGQETTDPHAVAGILPMAGHKGYAMAFLIDMLCGPLNGMHYGPHLNNMYHELDEHRRLGSLMIAIDPGRFFGGAMLAQAIVSAIIDVKRQGSAIQYPGEPEYRAEELRSAQGIPIEPGLWAEFETWSARLGIQLPDTSS